MSKSGGNISPPAPWISTPAERDAPKNFRDFFASAPPQVFVNGP